MSYITKFSTKLKKLYLISFLDCNKQYLKDRVNQHTRDIAQNRKVKALSQHSVDKQHTFNFKDVNVIDFENKIKILIKEVVHVKNKLKIFNKTTDTDHLSRIYCRIIKSLSNFILADLLLQIV